MASNTTETSLSNSSTVDVDTLNSEQVKLVNPRYIVRNALVYHKCATNSTIIYCHFNSSMLGRDKNCPETHHVCLLPKSDLKR